MPIVKISSCLCFCLFVFLGFINCCSAVDRVAAEEALMVAEDDLASAYKAVVGAENSGSDTSELIAVLESAGASLAEAYNLFRASFYDEAHSLAINCSNSVERIYSEASDLELKAEVAFQERLFVTASVSSAVLCVFSVLCLFVWRAVRRRYLSKALEMKPEVAVADES